MDPEPKTLDKREINSREERTVRPLPGQRRKQQLLLLLASVAFSVAAFLALDWLRTAAITRSAGKPASCRVSDPVRHHSYKPNCSFQDHWGKSWYDFSTNSLGLRDEEIRQITPTDARPRILLLGDSFTEGQLAWKDSFAGMIADHLPQYDFLNGGVGSYSPSNYLNVARIVLASGTQFDEAIIFIDTGDAADEASFYRDIDASGAVAGPLRQQWNKSWYATFRYFIAKHLLLSDYLLERLERQLVAHGYYHLTMTLLSANAFDVEGAAWPYRQVDEADPYPAGFAPLGVEGGIAKEKAKMTLLWQELQRHNVPISVVVYPYPGQVLHDTVDSRQVLIWREWCEGRCRRFISLFPQFLTVKQQCPQSQPGCWYINNFIFGDFHYNANGNATVADAVIWSLNEDPPGKVQPQVTGTAGQP
jgi:hypothetical protein